METEAESFKGADSAKTNKLEGPVKQRTRKSNAEQGVDTAMESNIKCGGEMEWLHSEVKSVKDKKSNTGKRN